jgi:hypothetical protein
MTTLTDDDIIWHLSADNRNKYDSEALTIAAHILLKNHKIIKYPPKRKKDILHNNPQILSSQMLADCNEPVVKQLAEDKDFQKKLLIRWKEQGPIVSGFLVLSRRKNKVLKVKKLASKDWRKNMKNDKEYKRLLERNFGRDYYFDIPVTITRKTTAKKPENRPTWELYGIIEIPNGWKYPIHFACFSQNSYIQVPLGGINKVFARVLLALVLNDFFK